MFSLAPHQKIITLPYQKTQKITSHIMFLKIIYSNHCYYNTLFIGGDGGDSEQLNISVKHYLYFYHKTNL